MTSQKEQKYLRELTACVRAHLAALDAEMEQPSTANRGRRIAALCNSLELANDRARHFGLGIELTRAEPRDQR